MAKNERKLPMKIYYVKNCSECPGYTKQLGCSFKQAPLLEDHIKNSTFPHWCPLEEKFNNQSYDKKKLRLKNHPEIEKQIDYTKYVVIEKEIYKRILEWWDIIECLINRDLYNELMAELLKDKNE